MKQKLLLLAMLWMSVANAQYFSRNYFNGGTPSSNRISGFNLRTTGTGYLIAGQQASGTNLAMPAIATTDVNGSVSFNNIYTLTGSSPLQCIGGVQAFELPAGTGYGAVGRYDDATSNGFYYYTVGVNGLPAGVMKKYRSPGLRIFLVRAVVVSHTRQEFYVLSSCAGSSPAMHIAKINIATGNVLWAAQYETPARGLDPESIILNPYVPGTVVVCGGVDNGTAYNGYIARINGNTGAVMSITEIGGVLAASNEKFYAIKKKDNTNGGGNGFVLTGSVNGDTWVVATDASTTGVLDSKSIDYSIPGTTNMGNDIVERLNTSGSYEYYVAGTVNGNNYVVVKLSSTLTVVGSGQFTSTTNVQVANKIDYYSGTANDGITIFGTKDPTGGVPANIAWLNITRLYFNGFTTCNNSIGATAALNYAITRPAMALGKKDTVLVDSAITVTATPMLHIQDCYSPVVPGGSNAKVIRENDNNNTASLSPNPAYMNDAVTIKLDGDNTYTSQSYTVYLYDMAGRLYDKREVTPENGKMTLNLSGKDLKEGLYFVTITGADTRHLLLQVMK